MADSRPNSAFVLVPAVLVALGTLGTAPAAGAATLDQCTEDIEVVGDKLAGDLRKNFSELRNVVITGCDARIEAKIARFTDLGFEDSRWTFEGSVRIRMEAQQGSLSSDQATVNFRNNQIERVDITGKPAEFEQKRSDSGAIARGHAGQIVYELGAGTVKLSNDAWLTDGSREIQSPTLVYDLRKQQVQASATPGNKSERVRVTISPKAKNGKSTPKITPAPTPPTGQTTPKDSKSSGTADPTKAP